MTDQHEHVIKTLNRLIKLCDDGNKGYKNAADQIENEEIRTILYRLSQQRALFEAELKNEVRNLGGTTDDSGPDEAQGTLLGNLHRKWIDLKEKLSSKEYEAVLEECKRGDKIAFEAYQEALKENLPAYIKEILTSQHHLIKGAYTQLQEFQAHPEGEQ
jgi:uncharacterized protein (TIGR02284 family)